MDDTAKRRHFVEAEEVTRGREKEKMDERYRDDVRRIGSADRVGRINSICDLISSSLQGDFQR